ncbi:DUF1028 domain-containing protein [Halobacteria archaeon AArc-m2/3/4]|uniref:DUF1028 domain-containing protein n=1 Tax=Natronoglomus mannanivorans TaxID=2979990 RepID=A0ABT2QKS5_9EURY|nr:DUF1028 domain-containing protein [Halobacteria archaeon AArc-m2/3/4]
MTFSICVYEPVETDGDESGDDEGEREHHDCFGVAVTTRLPGVGTLCPFASERGAVATQSLVNVDLGRRGIEYIDDGLAVDDALESLLNADHDASSRQLHGVDAEGTFVFSGEECGDWYGHREGDGYTVAGNLLTGESVLEAVADSYESSDRSAPLSKRLIDALAGGHDEGGDKREELSVQSAAVVVRTTEEHPLDPSYNDLRVDATETPIADLRETYEFAKEGYEAAMERYEESYEADQQETEASEAEEN